MICIMGLPFQSAFATHGELGIPTFPSSRGTLVTVIKRGTVACAIVLPRGGLCVPS